MSICFCSQRVKQCTIVLSEAWAGYWVRTSHNGETFNCNFCLHGFTRQDLFDEQVPYCSPRGMSFSISEKDQWEQFKHVNNQYKVPFVIYLDLESISMPVQSCSPSQNHSSTTPNQKHEPYVLRFCYHKQQPQLRNSPHDGCHGEIKG